MNSLISTDQAKTNPSPYDLFIRQTPSLQKNGKTKGKKNPRESEREKERGKNCYLEDVRLLERMFRQT